MEEIKLTTIMVPVTLPVQLKDVMEMFDPKWEGLGTFFSMCLKKEVDEWRERNQVSDEEFGSSGTLFNFFTGGKGPTGVH